MNDIVTRDSNSHHSTISHEQGLLWLDEIRNEVRKDVLVKNYLYSLSTRDLPYRSGLAAYAIGRNMPLHDFTSERNGWCIICGEYDFEETKRDFKSLKSWFDSGTIPWCDTSAVTQAYFLSETLRLPPKMPSQEDIEIFKQILSLAVNHPTKLTAPKFEKLLGREKILRSNAEERQGLLETFGFLSIFENPDYPGYFEQFIPRNYQPTKSTGGNYNYPVEWWYTMNGINMEALEFWFGPWIN